MVRLPAGSCGQAAVGRLELLVALVLDGDRRVAPIAVDGDRVGLPAEVDGPGDRPRREAHDLEHAARVREVAVGLVDGHERPGAVRRHATAVGEPSTSSVPSAVGVGRVGDVDEADPAFARRRYG